LKIPFCGEAIFLKGKNIKLFIKPNVLIMRNITLIFIAFFFSMQVFAQNIVLDKIEPPCWWVGMKNKEVQLMVYGENISLTQPKIAVEGVEISQITKVENEDYLFVTLRISENTTPQTFPIKFFFNGREKFSFNYELKARAANSAQRSGFSSADVLYLIMPDRFANGNPQNDNMPGMLETADRSNPDGRHGGDIEGIVKNLNYIKNLGVTTLWLNPFQENNQAKYSYHGYAISDFYKVDSRFGTNADYATFVNEAHKNNLKVVMDMVLNHCGSGSLLASNPPSKDWFNQWDEFTRTTYRASIVSDPYASGFDKNVFLNGWFDTNMPDFNQNNQMLMTYLIQMNIWWIEYAGLDGIRLDTQPYSKKEAVAEWAKAIFEEYPNFNIVGESWIDDPLITAYWPGDATKTDVYNSHIPCVTDFPLKSAMQQAFVEEEGWNSGLLRLYNTLAMDFGYKNPQNNLIFADNHDLSRIYSVTGEKIANMKLISAFLLTTRGIPMVYYGNELLMTGLEHEGHGKIREDFPGGWTGDMNNAFTPAGRNKEQNEYHDYLKKILDWRKTATAVHKGNLVHFLPYNNVYVYFRTFENQKVMVLINNSTDAREIEPLRYSEEIQSFTKGYDIITNQSVDITQKFSIKGKSAYIFELK